MLYQEILSTYGFSIAGIASNGEEAVNIFKSLNKKPDFILMDHRLPLKSGLEATKEILEMNNAIKIIFASADNSVKDQALSLGAVRFLRKPFQIKSLILCLEELIKTP